MKSLRKVAWIHYDAQGRQRIGYTEELLELEEGTDLYVGDVALADQAVQSLEQCLKWAEDHYYGDWSCFRHAASVLKQIKDTQNEQG